MPQIIIKVPPQIIRNEGVSQAPVPEIQPSAEYERFDELTKLLVNTPKPKAK
jgi:hypothetical protein